MMPEFLLAHSARGINFIAKNKEGDLREFFDREKGIEFGFGLRETLKVCAIDKEDNPIDFGEVVAPEATG